MSPADAFFWFFSLVLLLAGAGVILSRNPVHSAVFLVVVFLCLAGLFLLLHAFFLALVQVLVYAGAVVVLFLFVIMLLDLQPSALRAVRPAAAVLGGAVALGLAAEVFLLLRVPGALPAAAANPAEGDLAAVVLPLFRDHLLPLQLAALILLVSMIGVVALSRRDPA